MTNEVERIVLLGYMCSGKSTVGEALARRLGWDFVDFDVEIEKREARPVSTIIDTEGEAYFREMEARLTREAAEKRRLVMAPGGGWIMQPDLLDRIRPGTFSTWLRVSPEETVRRLKDDPSDRPLKNHPDPIGIVAEMLEEREPLYRRADLTVFTDGKTAEAVAFEIERLLRTRTADRR